MVRSPFISTRSFTKKTLNSLITMGKHFRSPKKWLFDTILRNAPYLQNLRTCSTFLHIF